MNNNPFVLPGFGQSGPMGQNPILASMEMMRQAWEGLASSGGLDASTMGRMMSVEEMDKRISDLRAVENWLRMNLSMLSSTIQGLEVQRATVATLKSFVDTGMASMTQPSGASPGPGQARPRAASPLEEVLGLKPGAGRDETPTQTRHAAADATRAASDAGGTAGQPEEQKDQAAGPAGAQPDQSDIVAAAASAAQGWWNLLQQQFQTLAAATAASAEGALSDLAEAGKAAGGAVPGQSAAGAGTKTAARTASKAASKTAARTTTAKKTTAGKTAAKAAGKTAGKTAAARKTSR